MNAKQQERFRKLGAWLCLLAMLFFYAPMAGAVCAARAASCCADRFCPISSHHHKHAAASQSAGEMQCEHGGVGLSSCSMDCCHRVEPSAVSATWFVLPTPAVLSFGSPHFTTLAAVNPTVDFLNQPPDSPPPRLAFA